MTRRSLRIMAGPRAFSGGHRPHRRSGRSLENCVFPGIGLPTTNRGVDVKRIELDPIAAPADPLGGQDRGAGPHEGIEDDVAPARAVAHRVSDKRDGLHRWVNGQVVHPPGPERIDPRIGPYVGAVSPVPPEFNVVLVRTLAALEDANQFVLRAVEAALAGVRFDPGDDVLQLRINGCPRRKQVADVPPVDKHEMDGAVRRVLCGEGQRRAQEAGELCRRHFAGALREIPGA